MKIRDAGKGYRAPYEDREDEWVVELEEGETPEDVRKHFFGNVIGRTLPTHDEWLRINPCAHAWWNGYCDFEVFGKRVYVRYVEPYCD